MKDSELKSLFTDHISNLQQQYDAIMAELSIDTLILDTGVLGYYYQDDQSFPFRSSHHFAHWCPLRGPEHLLKLKRGNKPKLLAVVPEDFWHEHKEIGDEYWTNLFDIEVHTSRQDAWSHIKALGGGSYLGPCDAEAEKHNLKKAPDGLLPRLNWNRSKKTDYEVTCLIEASRLGAIAHRAAEKAFISGGSELDIFNAYLQAISVTESELPYNAIICLNEKGAFLHYEAKRDDVKNGLSLLIDSGANYKGYASDITRTYASSAAPSEFKDLLESLNAMQSELVDQVRPGVSMGDLHYRSHEKLAEILLQHDLISGLSVQQSIEENVTKTFYPHGLGHMLGLLVHDVGGQQKDPEGNPCEKDPRMPKLRSLRTLDVGHVITVEPGLYFIKALLDKEQESERSKYYNWQLIEKLKPCGGIRIEDNVVVTTEGCRNLTRKFLP